MTQEKMKKMSKQLKPQIRFKGFEEEWEYCTFSEIFSPLKNNTLSRSCLSFSSDGVKNVHYGDVLIKFGSIIKIGSDELPTIINNFVPVLTSNNILQNGDVIFADTAEDEAVGKCSEIQGIEKEQIVSGLHTLPVRPKKSFGEFYLGNFLNSKSYHDTLRPYMQGIKVLSISKAAFSQTLISFPSLLSEQTSIGEFFSTIESLLKETEREIGRLEKIKQASLQKMFPRPGTTTPEIRFAGFIGDWKICKLSELLTQRIEHQKISEKEPLLAFSYAEGVIDPEDKKSNKRDFLMTDKDNKIFSRTELDDIIYNPANVIHGAIHRNALKTGVVSPIYKIFKCNENVSPKYMGFRLRTSRFISEIFKYIEGTVIKLRTLSPESFLNMEIEIPESLQEQELIGEYFSNLDSVIYSKRQKNTKLRQIKQACLDKMFVNATEL